MERVALTNSGASLVFGNRLQSSEPIEKLRRMGVFMSQPVIMQY